MLISLPNGRVVDIDPLYYLSLSEDDLQNMVASGIGFETENPFHSSVMHQLSHEDVDEIIEDIEDDEPLIKPLDEEHDREFFERDDI